MAAYIIRRLLLVLPTFFIIITINFFMIQLAPGGPVDQYIANQSGLGSSNLLQDRLAGTNVDEVTSMDNDEESFIKVTVAAPKKI